MRLLELLLQILFLFSLVKRQPSKADNTLTSSNTSFAEENCIRVSRLHIHIFIYGDMTVRKTGKNGRKLPHSHRTFGFPFLPPSAGIKYSKYCNRRMRTQGEEKRERKSCFSSFRQSMCIIFSSVWFSSMQFAALHCSTEKNLPSK